MTSGSASPVDADGDARPLPPNFERQVGPLPRWWVIALTVCVFVVIAASLVRILAFAAIAGLVVLVGLVSFALVFSTRRRRLLREYGTPIADESIEIDVAVPAHVQTAARPQNVLAVVAFVLAFFFSVPAIVCGHIALVQVSRTGERGRGLAVAALIMGYLQLAATVALIIVLYSG